MRKGILVFGVAALASVLANVATLAPVNAMDNYISGRCN